jgi:hypothetical protein
MVVVYLFILRSLLSNGFTSHNIFKSNNINSVLSVQIMNTFENISIVYVEFEVLKLVIMDSSVF